MGQADAGTSFARLPDITGHFQSVPTPTPGARNRLTDGKAVEATTCRILMEVAQDAGLSRRDGRTHSACPQAAADHCP